MDIFTIYAVLFFVIFLIMPTVYFLMKFILWLILEYFACSKPHTRTLNQQRRYNQYRDQRQYLQQYYDRQGNIFTITDEAAVNNNSARRYHPDFFYLEPNSVEASRIREQLEKDEKDLPSYEEVIRMSNMAVATQTASCGTPTLGVSTTSIATTDTILTVPPPYSENIDENVINVAPAVPASSQINPVRSTAPTATATTITTGVTTESAASTSQAAVASSV